MRLIDADKIPWTDLNDNPNSNIKVLVTFAEKVNRMPTIERKTGRWIDMWDKNDPYTSSRGRCSICGRESDRPLGDYCKWCGADMMSLPEPYKEGTDNQITACPMCPDCPDNCPLGEDMRGDETCG